MQGLHLTADLHNCRCEQAWLLDGQKLAAWCQNGLQSLGLASSSQLFQGFQGFQGPDGTPEGLSGAAVMPGAHVAIHSRLRQKSVLIDICITDLVADHEANARAVMQVLADLFAPEWTEQRSLDRGDES